MQDCEQAVEKTDPFEGYDQIGAVNWSTLGSMTKSAKQYQHDLEKKWEPSSAALIGLAVHCLVLEPEMYPRRFVTCEIVRNKRHKAFQEFMAEHEGKTILSKSESDNADGCASAVLFDSEAMGHLAGATTEFANVWIDEETGIQCKSRIDLVNGHLGDMKTTGDVREKKFGKIAFDLNYPGKIAFYLDGLIANGHSGVADKDPFLIVAEQKQPHDVAVYVLPRETVEFGRRQYRECLNRLVWCRENNRWPGYSEGQPLYLHVPPWMTRDDSKIAATVDGMALEI